MDVLSHYEDHISLTEEEQAVYLKGKWKLNKVGYEYSDDYGVNQVSEDEYATQNSSIDYIEINNGIITFNFKQPTRFTRRFVIPGDAAIKEEELWYSSYTPLPDGSLFTFGFNIDDVEIFEFYEPISGGLQTQMSLYGIESLNSYKIKRVVLRSNADHGHDYEFVHMD